MMMNKKQKSQKLEKQLAKNLKGSVTPGSGAFAGHKGDVITRDFLIEHKYTDKTGYSLKYDIVNKIKQEAFNRGRIPMMEIVLDPDHTNAHYILMELDDFQSYTNCSSALFKRLFKTKKKKINKNSFLIKKDNIKKFIDEVECLAKRRIPGFILDFSLYNSKQLLLTTKDFITILDFINED